MAEGQLVAGERVTVLEEVLSTGAQAIATSAKPQQAGAEVIHLVGVLDREEGATEQIRQAGLAYTLLPRTSDLPV